MLLDSLEPSVKSIKYQYDEFEKILGISTHHSWFFPKIIASSLLHNIFVCTHDSLSHSKREKNSFSWANHILWNLCKSRWKVCVSPDIFPHHKKSRNISRFSHKKSFTCFWEGFLLCINGLALYIRTTESHGLYAGFKRRVFFTVFLVLERASTSGQTEREVVMTQLRLILSCNMPSTHSLVAVIEKGISLFSQGCHGSDTWDTFFPRNHCKFSNVLGDSLNPGIYMISVIENDNYNLFMYYM